VPPPGGQRVRAERERAGVEEAARDDLAANGRSIRDATCLCEQQPCAQTRCAKHHLQMFRSASFVTGNAFHSAGTFASNRSRPCPRNLSPRAALLARAQSRALPRPRRRRRNGGALSCVHPITRVSKIALSGAAAPVSRRSSRFVCK